MYTRARIRVLDDVTISKIAAGEVVTSPAAVVKELVENAIDALATEISVEIKSPGFRLITVSDNGFGMSRDDLIVAFERHATSKIRNISELAELKTLGFRGEALPSIAAVSRMEAISRPVESLIATAIRIEGGIIKAVKETAAPPGTTFHVRNLFFNVPVRRKFMKEFNVEKARVTEVLEAYIMARPDISFSLSFNNKELLKTRKNSTLRDNMAVLYGSEVAERLIEIESERELKNGKLVLSGFISLPDDSRSSSRHQHIFVNGRPIKHKLVARAIYEAYHRLLPIRRFPVTALFIEAPPGFVDFNIHPQKTEVKFENEAAVYELVLNTLEKALKAGGILSNARIYVDGEKIKALPRELKKDSPVESSLLSVSSAAAGTELFEKKENHGGLENLPFQPFETGVHSDPDELARKFSSKIEIRRLPVLKPSKESRHDEPVHVFDFTLLPVGQLFNSFLLVQHETGLVIMDQHAASERVFFEKFKYETDFSGWPSQGLLVPLLLELPRSEATIVAANLEKFKEVGFLVEHFGDCSFIVREVPVILGEIEDRDLIVDVVEDIIEGLGARTDLDIRDRIIARAACKKSIKAGERINFEGAMELIRELLRTRNPYACPHGRPTMLHLSLEDILKGFKRK